MNREKFTLSEEQMRQIEDFLFRQAMRNDYVLSEVAEAFYCPEDLVLTDENGKEIRKFTWLEAAEIESYIRGSFPGFRLPTVSEYGLMALEATGDDLDGRDVVRELGLNRNGIGHPVGRGVAEHEGEWAAYWTGTEAPSHPAIAEHQAYALIITETNTILDRERVDVNRRLSFRVLYDLNP
ncbi:hypothetical protein IJH66_00720 [Candidatus Saccharibacteria bacterium]|nr:hypothetical protein [Candidatus Saccharibacteria bacterium]